MESQKSTRVLRSHREFKKFGKLIAKLFVFFGIFIVVTYLFNEFIHTNVLLIVFNVQKKPNNFLADNFVERVPFSGRSINGYYLISTMLIFCIINSIVGIIMLYFNKNSFIRRSYICSFPLVSIIVWIMRILSGIITILAVKLFCFIVFHNREAILEYWQHFGVFNFGTFAICVIILVFLFAALNLLFFLWILCAFPTLIKPKYDEEMMNSYIQFQEYSLRQKEFQNGNVNKEEKAMPQSPKN